MTLYSEFANIAYTMRYTKTEVVEMLRSRMESTSLSLRKFSVEVLKVTPSYLSEVYRGTRRPGENILEYLGLERHLVVEEYYSPKGGKTRRKAGKYRQK